MTVYAAMWHRNSNWLVLWLLWDIVLGFRASRVWEGRRRVPPLNPKISWWHKPNCEHRIGSYVQLVSLQILSGEDALSAKQQLWVLHAAGMTSAGWELCPSSPPKIGVFSCAAGAPIIFHCLAYSSFKIGWN